MTTRWAKEAACYGLPGLVLAAATAVALGAQQRLVATAAALDLTITAPAVAYLLLVRTGRMRWPLLVPMVVVGFLLAEATLPSVHQDVLVPLRFLAIPGEIALVIYLVLAARKALAGEPGQDADVVTRFRSTAHRALGNRVAADVVTTEAMLLYYALRPRQPREAGAFTVHRSAGYGPILVALAMAIVVETVAVHFFVRLWSPALAWVLTGLSVYALLWLLGDFRALASRTSRVNATHFLFRFGLRWEADIPLDQIEVVSDGERAQSARVVSLLGAPNLHLRFTEPVQVLGLYGWRRKMQELRLRVDDPVALRAALGGP